MAEPTKETADLATEKAAPKEEKAAPKDEKAAPKATADSGVKAHPMPGSGRRSPATALLVVVTLIAVAALGIAIWALVRPPSGSSASPTGEQSGEAKGRTCADFNTVRTAVSLQTHADLGRDRVAVQAVAANARLAMAAGGSYLLDRMDEATPPDLADAVRSFAKGLEDIAINALAGVSNEDPAQAARLRDTQAASNRVADLCK